MLLNLIFITCVSTKFPLIFNYLNHSYYVSDDVEESSKIYCICQSNGYYWIDIDNKEENYVIKNMLTNNVKLGFYKSSLGVYRSFYDDEKISYFHDTLPSSSSKTQVMLSPTGEWSLGDRKSKGYYICESDKTSPNHRSVSVFDFPVRNFTYKNKKYDVFTHPGAKKDAEEACKRLNSKLYAPENEEENCVVNGNVDFDIVLNVDPTKQQKYTNWEKGYPLKHGDCVYSDSATGKWTNKDCQNSNFVCVSPSKSAPADKSNADCKNKIKNEDDVVLNTYEKNGRTYRLYNNSHSYYGNKEFCHERGMKFYPSNDDEVVDQVRGENKVDVYTDYRISWEGNSWKWTDKAPPMSFKWEFGQPMNHAQYGIECTCIQPNGRWVVKPCDTHQKTICVEEKVAGNPQHSNKKTLLFGISGLLALIGLILLFTLVARRASRKTEGRAKYKTTMTL